MSYRTVVVTLKTNQIKYLKVLTVTKNGTVKQFPGKASQLVKDKIVIFLYLDLSCKQHL